jgi:hypothetical protein
MPDPTQPPAAPPPAEPPKSGEPPPEAELTGPLAWFVGLIRGALVTGFRMALALIQGILGAIFAGGAANRPPPEPPADPGDRTGEDPQDAGRR